MTALRIARNALLSSGIGYAASIVTIGLGDMFGSMSLIVLGMLGGIASTGGIVLTAIASVVSQIAALRLRRNLN